MARLNFLVAFIYLSIPIAQAQVEDCPQRLAIGELAENIDTTIGPGNVGPLHDWLMLHVEYVDCLIDKQSFGEALVVLNSTALQSIADHIVDAYPETTIRFYLHYSHLLALTNNHNRALRTAEKAAEILTQNFERLSKDIEITVYLALGIRNYRKQNIQTAIRYCDMVVELCGNNPERIAKKVEAISTKALQLAKKRDTEASEEAFESAEAIITKAGTARQRKELRVILGTNRISADYISGKYQQALDRGEALINLSTEVHGKNHRSTFLIYGNCGNAAFYTGKYHLALEYYGEALGILDALSFPNRERKASDILSKSVYCHTYLEHFDKAEQKIERIIQLTGFDLSGRSSLTKVDMNEESILRILLFPKNITHLRSYEATDDIGQLRAAVPYHDLTIDLLERVFADIGTASSKTNFVSRYYSFFEIALTNYHYLYAETDSLKYLKKAFSVAERSKAMLLKAAVYQAGAVEQFAIPEALLARKKAIQAEITKTENTLYEQKWQAQSGGVHLKRELIAQQRSLQHLKDSILLLYPKYAQLAQYRTALDLDRIQRDYLEDDQTIVQYFVGYYKLFVFAITKNGMQFEAIDTPRDLDKKVNTLRESIYGWAFSPMDSLLADYRRTANELYGHLLTPVEAQLTHKLIIITDGILEFLPFDALLYDSLAEHSTSLADYPFLIKRHQISYAHSLQLLLDRHQQRPYRAEHQKILVYAPDFTDDKDGTDATIASRQRSLGTLLYNTREAERIGEIFPAAIRMGRQATAEQFNIEASSYQVLHLATHAKANDSKGAYSYLAFAPAAGDTSVISRLYAADLFLLDLKADLVTISACEGSIGQLEQGEGAMSLARGFAHAGARSILTSLWRVDDAAAAQLMTDFYVQLRSGSPKDEALRAAKLKFLSDAQGQRSHPFYWAAFVPVGDMSPLQMASDRGSSWFWLSLLIMIMGLGVWIFFRRNKR